ncbi:MAG: hypothetical protein HZA17_14480, partial [Nitrospirae bacterium]|nr:hypothetical protein [Nitrospirota bacterium]
EELQKTLKELKQFKELKLGSTEISYSKDFIEKETAAWKIYSSQAMDILIKYPSEWIVAREYIEEEAMEIRGSDYVEGDPMFVNASEADFRLQGNSPAIDGGSSLNAPGNDFDGNPRPSGAGHDIGAYEYVSQP